MFGVTQYKPTSEWNIYVENCNMDEFLTDIIGDIGEHILNQNEMFRIESSRWSKRYARWVLLWMMDEENVYDGFIWGECDRLSIPEWAEIDFDREPFNENILEIITKQLSGKMMSIQMTVIL